jgi:type I restriction enzyme, S subunit
MNPLLAPPSETKIEFPRAVRFDAILSRVERKVMVDDDSPYSTVGVRWYGNGAFVREHLRGADIGRKQQWIVRAGDVVYNKLFAWKGAFAIADGTVDGHLVSDKFPTYQHDRSLVDPRYLRYFFRTPELALQALNLSKGAAAISKLTLNPPQFWDLSIPLPELAQQQRVAETLENLEKSVLEADRTSEAAMAGGRALLVSAITAVLGDVAIDGRLGDVLLEKPRNGWSAPCDNAESGIPVLSLRAITGFNYREREFKRTSEATDPSAHYWLRPGDLLMTRSNTPELVGHAAIYNGTPSPCIYPDLTMRLRVDPSEADTRFVHYWLRSTPARDYVKATARGTSPTMKKIGQGDVMAIPFPTKLSLSDQQRVVAWLDELSSKLDALLAVQESRHASLAAIWAASLNDAFRGTPANPQATD